jgi:hypothetical protein
MKPLNASLDALVANPGLAPALTPAERARLLVQAAAVLAVLGAAALRPDDTLKPEPEPADRLLTAEEAAPIAGLTVRQLKARELPFKRKLGHRTIRFSARGLARWLERPSRGPHPRR